MAEQEDAEEFEAWLTYVPDALEEFLELLPEDLAAKVDFSQASLAALERWLLESFLSMDAYDKQADTKLVDGVARYIGETFRRNFGGRWDIDLKNKPNVFYKLPVLAGLGESALCPHLLATALQDRRTGTYLSRIFANHT